MGIFPDSYARNTITNAITTTTTITPKLLKEYAIDFDTGEIAIDDNGKFTIVEGIEAVKVRNWLALQIQRNRYIIYPSNFGNELKTLIGKGISYINKNIQKLLEDALLDGIYVTSLKDISVTPNEDKVTITFTIDTIYGSYTDSKIY